MTCRRDACSANGNASRRCSGCRGSRFYLCTVVALVASLRTIEVIPEFLYDAPDQMVDLFRRMWPPDSSYIATDAQGR